MTGEAIGDANANAVSLVAAPAVGTAIGDSSAFAGGFRRLPRVRHISSRERIKRASPVRIDQNLIITTHSCTFQADLVQSNAFQPCLTGTALKLPSIKTKATAKRIKTTIGWKR
jgi:hypothetical protein